MDNPRNQSEPATIDVRGCDLFEFTDRKISRTDSLHQTRSSRFTITFDAMLFALVPGAALATRAIGLRLVMSSAAGASGRDRCSAVGTVVEWPSARLLWSLRTVRPSAGEPREPIAVTATTSS